MSMYREGERQAAISTPPNVHSCFSYDADGKRVTKQDAEGLTRFIYLGPDMLKLMQELDERNLIAHDTIGDGLESIRRGEASRSHPRRTSRERFPRFLIASYWIPVLTDGLSPGESEVAWSQVG